eukprot:gene5862-6153_t
MLTQDWADAPSNKVAIERNRRKSDVNGFQRLSDTGGGAGPPPFSRSSSIRLDHNKADIPPSCSRTTSCSLLTTGGGLGTTGGGLGTPPFSRCTSVRVDHDKAEVTPPCSRTPSCALSPHACFNAEGTASILTTKHPPTRNFQRTTSKGDNGLLLSPRSFTTQGNMLDNGALLSPVAATSSRSSNSNLNSNSNSAWRPFPKRSESSGSAPGSCPFTMVQLADAYPSAALLAHCPPIKPPCFSLTSSLSLASPFSAGSGPSYSGASYSPRASRTTSTTSTASSIFTPRSPMQKSTSSKSYRSPATPNSYETQAQAQPQPQPQLLPLAQAHAQALPQAQAQLLRSPSPRELRRGTFKAAAGDSYTTPIAFSPKTSADAPLHPDVSPAISASTSTESSAPISAGLSLVLHPPTHPEGSRGVSAVDFAPTSTILTSSKKTPKPDIKVLADVGTSLAPFRAPRTSSTVGQAEEELVPPGSDAVQMQAKVAWLDCSNMPKLAWHEDSETQRMSSAPQMSAVISQMQPKLAWHEDPETQHVSSAPQLSVVTSKMQLKLTWHEDPETQHVSSAPLMSVVTSQMQPGGCDEQPDSSSEQGSHVRLCARSLSSMASANKDIGNFGLFDLLPQSTRSCLTGRATAQSINTIISDDGTDTPATATSISSSVNRSPFGEDCASAASASPARAAGSAHQHNRSWLAEGEALPSPATPTSQSMLHLAAVTTEELEMVSIGTDSPCTSPTQHTTSHHAYHPHNTGACTTDLSPTSTPSTWLHSSTQSSEFTSESRDSLETLEPTRHLGTSESTSEPCHLAPRHTTTSESTSEPCHLAPRHTTTSESTSEPCHLAPRHTTTSESTSAPRNPLGTSESPSALRNPLSTSEFSHALVADPNPSLSRESLLGQASRAPIKGPRTLVSRARLGDESLSSKAPLEGWGDLDPSTKVMGPKRPCAKLEAPERLRLQPVPSPRLYSAVGSPTPTQEEPGRRVDGWVGKTSPTLTAPAPQSPSSSPSTNLSSPIKHRLFRTHSSHGMNSPLGAHLSHSLTSSPTTNSPIGPRLSPSSSHSLGSPLQNRLSLSDTGASMSSAHSPTLGDLPPVVSLDPVRVGIMGKVTLRERYSHLDDTSSVDSLGENSSVDSLGDNSSVDSLDPSGPDSPCMHSPDPSGPDSPCLHSPVGSFTSTYVGSTSNADAAPGSLRLAAQSELHPQRRRFTTKSLSRCSVRAACAEAERFAVEPYEGEVQGKFSKHAAQMSSCGQTVKKLYWGNAV